MRRNPAILDPEPVPTRLRHRGARTPVSLFVTVAALAVTGCSTGTPSTAGGTGEDGAVPTTPAATNPPGDEPGLIAPDVVEAAFTAFLPERRPTAVEDRLPAEGSISCPEGVAARATAATRCTWRTPGGASHGITATVTQVDEDGTPRFSFDVFPLVTPGAAADQSSAVAAS